MMSSSESGSRMGTGAGGGSAVGSPMKSNNSNTNSLNLSAEAMRYCAVLGCSHTGLKLKAWKKSPCAEHVGAASHMTCGCKEPFMLFPFPREVALRKTWLQRIGLPDLEISDATRICSVHFVEGKPTTRSFLPTLYLQPDLSDEDSNNELSNEEDLALDDFIDEGNETGGDPLSFSEVSKVEDVVVGTNSFDQVDCLREDEFSIEDDGMNEEDFQFKVEKEDVSSRSNDSNSNGEMLLPEESEEMSVATTSNANSPSTAVSKREIVAEQEQDDDDDIQITYQKPTILRPMASYDPHAQVLQVSDPVKYIQQCHTRISQLLAEKEDMKKSYDFAVAEKEDMKKSYEVEIERLKYLNTSLKRRFLNPQKRKLKKLFTTTTMIGISRPRLTPKFQQKKGRIPASNKKS